ncbi:MAG: nicotinate-nucleotide--dimethylbenzimidazole phosphoribosyltransferase [Pseudomonadota bacterium]
MNLLLTPAQQQQQAARSHAVQAQLDALTKPPGALGLLEALAMKLAVVLGGAAPQPPLVLVFAGDHGLVAEGVSCYPAEVTPQMVANILAGGAAVSVLAAQHALPLYVVDAGVAVPLAPHPRLLANKVAAGTANARHAAAMSTTQAQAALDAGAAALATAVAAQDRNTVIFGEMGIGNSAIAALLVHAFTGIVLDDCIGRGTGVDDAGLAHKRRVLAGVVARHGVVADPLARLAAYGGFELAAMAGAMIAAAQQGRLILVDGYIASAALAVAVAFQPATLDACVFCHCSAEPGHRKLLAHWQATPLLDWQMRLGEGSGAVLAWPLLAAAHAMRTQMATFASAQVSTPA